MTNNSRPRRAHNIHALRLAIKRAQSASDAPRALALCAELDRLARAEVEDYQGVEDAPADLMRPELLTAS